MRTIKRKACTLGFIFCCMIVGTFAIFTTINNNSAIVHAQEISENTTIDVNDSSAKAKELIVSIENELQEQGTSISAVLQSQRDFYVNELNEGSTEEQDIILSKIDTVDRAIEEFALYSRILPNSSNADISTVDEVSPYVFNISPNCTCGTFEYLSGTPCINCIEYTDVNSSVTAVAAGFEMRGWSLAADLLWFNKSNTTLDIDYWPTLGTKIAQAPQIADEVAYSDNLTASFSQDSPGRLNGLFESTIEGDTYNSLGGFYYGKTAAENGNVNISILDRYDWHYKDNGSAGELNNIMFRAQELGILIPFYTRINLTIPGYVPFDWEYRETGVCITGMASDITGANIPTEIDDLRVRVIGNLPKVNITEIKTNALANQTQLTNVILPNTITEIGANAFTGCTNLTSITLSDALTIIGDNAFANCTNLTSITIPDTVTTIGENAFAGCTNLTSINIPANVSLIGNGAFKGCNNLNITVSPDNTNYSAQDNILYDKEKATIVGAGKVANDIVVPNTVTTILSNAFEDNNNLETVRFNTVPIIGDYAFAGCSTLYAVHFDTYSVPTVGTGVFLDDIFVLYVPYIAQDSFKTAFSEYAESVTSVEVPMVFIADGAVIETWTIYDGSTLGDLPTATKVGYDFVGWYDNVDSTGTLYQSGALLDTETGLTVYAAWTPKRYSVTLDANGGTVTGTNAIEVTYGSDFSVTATANRDGYTLEGWFDEGGTKYVTVDGESTRTWDKAENTTLYAQWIVERYEIQINDNGTITWLSEDGLSDEPCSIPYGAVLNAINLVKIFKDSSQGFKEGKIFDHFEYEDASIEWTSIPDFGEDGAIVTIIPVWIVEVHKIYFNTLTDIVVPEIIADYDADIALPTVSRVGYEFDGWYTSTSAGTKVNWTKMPDLTLNEQKDGSITLYAGWIENVYSVSYNANGGVGAMSATTHTYEGNELLALNTFTREIHNFIGWSTTSSGEVEYVDGASIKDLVAEGSGSLALYAVWKKKTYKIIYSNLYFGDVKAEVLKGTSYEKAEEEYYHGEGFDLTNIRGYFKADSPYSPHFHFLGWYTDLGLTTQITSIPKDKNADVIVYAKWRYDFDNPSRSGSYTITDAARFDQPYDQVWAGLTYNNLYTNLKNMGIEYLAITLKIKLYEIDDGYQCLFLYDGSGSDANLLWEKEIEHGGTGKSGTAKVYKTQIYIPIESIQNADYLYFRYRAHGAFDDDWVNVEIYYEMMYVTEKEDIDAVEFYWDYQDPYDDSDCIEV